MCGEKHQSTFLAHQSQGSPPRVRGKVSILSFFVKVGRITPACAGKRPASIKPARTAKDHPRVCGEKIIDDICSRGGTGSPPRVRGKGLSCALSLLSPRITPACAGKSLRHRPRASSAGDHPRVCGEKTESVFLMSRIIGSPPRVRGKGPAVIHIPALRGITPACAGKSQNSPPVCSCCGDHPRVCGEKGDCRPHPLCA